MCLSILFKAFAVSQANSERGDSAMQEVKILAAHGLISVFP